MKRYKETRLSEFFRKISETTSAVTAETAVDTRKLSSQLISQIGLYM